MENKLKPCPFCGGEAELQQEIGKFFREAFIHYRVVCKDSRCRGASYNTWVDKPEAIKAWNTRAVQPCETCSQINNPDSFIFHLLQGERVTYYSTITDPRLRASNHANQRRTQRGSGKATRAEAVGYIHELRGLHR